MVTSSSIAIATNDECLMCGGFSLDEPVRLGNFEFFADYFGGLSLSSRRGDEGTAFVGSTHSGGIYTAVSQDGGLHQGVPDGVKRGRKIQPPFPQMVQHRGLIRPRHNHNMKGERSSHDVVSPMDDGVVAENQPPLRVVSCSP
jgi:hypothetical protein